MMDAPTLMVKARIACESARALLERKDTDGACNRAYYAMFDAARAALLVAKPDIAINVGKTHSGLLASFSQHLVKDGPVPREIGRLLKQAEEIRIAADYSGDFIELADARRIVEAAETFVATLAAVLSANPTHPGK